MKNLMWIALLFVGMTSLAQEKKVEDRKAKSEKGADLTPEQRNQLRLKELTLALDLSTQQQAEMAKIIAEQQAKRAKTKAEWEAKKGTEKKLTSEEKFVMKNKILDEKIAMKDRLKKVLNPEQLEKYEKMGHQKKSRVKKHFKHQKSKEE